MTTERFNEILNGPLHGEGLMGTRRVSQALRAVVEATGKQGEEAPEAYCESVLEASRRGPAGQKATGSEGIATKR